MNFNLILFLLGCFKRFNMDELIIFYTQKEISSCFCIYNKPGNLIYGICRSNSKSVDMISLLFSMEKHFHMNKPRLIITTIKIYQVNVLAQY